MSAQIESLLGEIRVLELAHKKSHAQQIEEKLMLLREKLNILLMEKAKLTRCRRALYKYGNKPSRMLANALERTEPY